MSRPSFDQTMFDMLRVLAKRSTCLDKQVACILTDKNNHIIATGYNGSPKGEPHCIDYDHCPKNMTDNPLQCKSAHAEQNALIQCTKPFEIYSCYTTLSPCIACTRMLMNTSCQRILFLSEHRHPEAKEMWRGEWWKGEWMVYGKHL